MTAPLWTSEAISAASKGRTNSLFSIDGISIDSRQPLQGNLFIAIVGNQFDGHDYVDAALKAGAVGALVHQKPPGVSKNDPRLIFVDNTFKALEDIARAARERSNAHVVGITGSVGKTGTKEMLLTAFKRLGPSYANEGNLNNHLGVPLSLARLPENTKFAVFEMGMNHSGEIRPLTRMVNPHTAIVTRIAPAHMEFFSSLEAIADAKAEIFEGLTDGGVAILNADDPLSRRLAKAIPEKIKILHFGSTKGSDVELLSADLDENGSRINASIEGNLLSWEVKIAGAHWVQNSLAVVAAVHATGGDIRKAAAAICKMDAPKGRGKRHQFCGIDVIDETYNASPAAVRAAFKTLALTNPKPGGKRIFILGDMLELGDTAAADHAALAGDFLEAGLDCAHGVGPLARNFLEALPEASRGRWAPDSQVLARSVKNLASAGDVVLIKGSFSTHMEKIVEAMKKQQNKPEGQANAF